ncbi:hypothetical protein P3T76_012474 [Phytophthora citrophthora]|uniref:Uncharacterized protein n=1 Tax=Phytophthora citrophthora TaxID=4793 RepID=A0AAD9LE07_9STRA|nr:hypothetical protein P3T76_012474 [Phytophthora citrophthora]
MTTTEGGEPSKEPAVNGTPSPAKHNANKTKRLLPMELRKRRRAAKLQVSAEKKAKVEFKATPVPPTPSYTSSSPGTKGRKEEKQSEKTSPAKAGRITPPMQTPLLQSKGSGSTRLKMLYASSINPQRRQLIPGGNVPNTFHVSSLVAELPLDFVPKTKLSILTAFPYPFHRLSSKVKKQALQDFMSASDTRAKQPSIAVRWQQALHYFMHPANSVPTSLLLNRTTTATTSEPLLGGPKGERKREEKAFFTARWNTWQEAFRDVYLNFRRQSKCRNDSGALDGSFYLRSSEFVVHFLYDAGSQHAGTSIIKLCRQYEEEKEATEEAKRTKNCSLRAVMSQSSARIRKVLHHLNVDYTMPYIKANQTQQEAGEFHLLEEELEASRKRNQDRSGGSVIAPVTGSTAPENMHGADSLLLFHGHDAVHGLYEFLINRAPMSNQDVPELYALHPFANASIQTLQAKSFGCIGVAAPDSVSEGSSRPPTLFRVEILGFCFPLSIARLLAVLKDEWEAAGASYDSPVSGAGGNNAQVALRVYMEAMAGAERLNAVNLEKQGVNGRGDQQEQQKWQQQLEYSKRRMETAVVTKVEGHYDVETTIRAIGGRR